MVTQRSQHTAWLKRTVPIPRRPPDWQLPAGLTPGLWDYVHDESLARSYDAALHASPLLDQDAAWLRQELPSTPGRLLDLGCGTGRTVASAVAWGWQGVGVDLSPGMLATAMGRSIASAHFVRANIVELDGFADASFDAVTCLFSTLGLIQPGAARRQVLRHAHRLLKPGGKFLWHAHNRWANLWLPTTRRWVLADTLKSLWQPGHEPGNWTMPPHHGLAKLLVHLFTPNEALQLMRDLGFHAMRLTYVPDPITARVPAWPGLRAIGFFVAGTK